MISYDDRLLIAEKFFKQPMPDPEKTYHEPGHIYPIFKGVWCCYPKYEAGDKCRWELLQEVDMADAVLDELQKRSQSYMSVFRSDPIRPHQKHFAFAIGNYQKHEADTRHEVILLAVLDMIRR